MDDRERAREWLEGLLRRVEHKAALRADVDSLTAEFAAVRREALETLRYAVDAECSCGGRGPRDGACQACMVWHRVKAGGALATKGDGRG